MEINKKKFPTENCGEEIITAVMGLNTVVFQCGLRTLDFSFFFTDLGQVLRIMGFTWFFKRTGSINFQPGTD